MMGALVAIIGWATLIVGGAYVAAVVAFLATSLRGGIETLGAGIRNAALAAAVWVALLLWLSPLSFTIH